MLSSTAFALAAPAPARIAPTATTAPADRARVVVEQGRKRARALMYGAGGAFRGLADRRRSLERLMRASGFPPGNGSNGFGGHDDGEDDDDFDVDPSWGVAPSAHLLLRGRSDATYRAAVQNLIAMSAALSTSVATPPSFVDSSVPVVVILGWMGASRKHLSKYSKFYEDLGYEVHCIVNDLRTAIFPPASKAQAARVGAIINDQPDGRPVFVHAFSIGTGIYGLLLDSVQHEAEKFEQFTRKVTGVVFDSGPAPIFPKDVAKGLNTVCPIISKKLWEVVASSFFFVTKARFWYGKSEEALRQIQFPSPQLYFYSGDDKVIPNMKNAVEDFMDKNKQRGVEVYNKFWEKSVHASHMKMHREEYLANLSSFLDRCMEIRKQQEKVAAPAIASN